MARNMTWISTRAAAQRRPTSGNSRVTARPPMWPGLGANMSQRDPDAPTDAEVSALRPAQRSSASVRFSNGRLRACCAPCRAHPRGAQCVLCAATRRQRRTTGRELGETAGARPKRKAEGARRFWPPHQADGRSKMGARDAIGNANGAPTKHRAGAMISTQPVANAG